MKEKYNILSGPNKDSFLESFLAGFKVMEYERKIKFKVTFEKWKPSKIILDGFEPDDPDVYLKSIEKIDKNPEQFNFTAIRVMPSSSKWSKEVKGFYDCKEKTGWYEDIEE